MDDDKSRTAAEGPVQGAVRPLGEPLFLLHCGAVHGGEMDDWDVEANSGRAVDELTAQHPGKDLHLYALTPEEVAAVNKLSAALVQATAELEEAQRKSDLLQAALLDALRVVAKVDPRGAARWLLEQGIRA